MSDRPTRSSLTLLGDRVGDGAAPQAFQLGNTEFTVASNGIVDAWADDFARMGPPQSIGYRTVGLFRRGILGAAVRYHRDRESDVEMHLCIEDKRCVTRRTLRLLLGYPFTSLGAQRITATVEASNAAARSFVERLGFKLEGVKRRGFWQDDACIYGLLREDNPFP